MTMAEYRHEYKYLAPESTLAILEQRVSAILRPDSHADGSGAYTVRSLYFDDLFDSCMRENSDGTEPREKFRLRIYNNDASHISLELKRKKQGKTQKLSCPLSGERCRAILEGKIPSVDSGDHFLYKKLLMLMRSRGLRPVTIVSYERTPFVWQQGNVRITFDRSITSADDFSCFFSDELPCRPVLPSVVNLLEVKFDEFLPDFIFEILQTGRLKQTSFSKYYICRKYQMAGPVYAHF